MKKVLFAAFAGGCLMVSVMGTSANAGKTNHNTAISQYMLKDTVPGKGKRSDTSSYPKKDTSSMPRLTDGVK
jgi:hypothetical protein